MTDTRILSGPDFFQIGAAKAGTTSLYEAICRHPQVYKPPLKEPRYLNFHNSRPQYTGPGSEKATRRIISDLQMYQGNFSGCLKQQIAGDFSNDYLDDANAPKNASLLFPQARIITIFRDPVERAFSEYLHARHCGREAEKTFLSAWNSGADRTKNHWLPSLCYKQRGFYFKHISRWLEQFPRQQILILFYEDWCNNPSLVLSAVWRHLGIPEITNPKITRENISSRQPRWDWLHHRMIDRDNRIRLLAQRRLPLWARDAVTTAVGTFNLRPGPTLDPSLRARLAVTYHDDISQLEALTGRDLIAWRS
jgi:hypothetical protein